MKKLGILGLGHMGMAIAKGALNILPPEEIVVYGHGREKMETAASLGLCTAENPADLCQKAHMVILAVRPQNIAGLLEELSDVVPECLLTVAAGVPIRRFTGVFGEIPVIRAMPNTPLQYQSGATALCHNEACPQEDFRMAMELFSAMGCAYEITEAHMCDIIAVNGSTPAYFYYLIECLLDDAKRRGIDEQAARDLLVQTMIGSGIILKNNPDKPVGQFVDEVCSKGGTTIEAIQVLKDGGFEDLIRKADDACIRRAEELGK
ncbi:MAG: pyrroline-5-carboxylate reductase [Solobacterium sp.]|nr:pyrroline-5-carboxylate reductase [Solobacterium sp.]